MITATIDGGTYKFDATEAPLTDGRMVLVSEDGNMTLEITGLGLMAVVASWINAPTTDSAAKTAG